MAHFHDELNRRVRSTPFNDNHHFEKVDRAKSIHRKRIRRNTAAVVTAAIMLVHGFHSMVVTSQLGQRFNTWNQQRLAAKQAEQQRLAAERERLLAPPSNRNFYIPSERLVRLRVIADVSPAPKPHEIKLEQIETVRAAILDLDIASDTTNSPTAFSPQFVPTVSSITSANFDAGRTLQVVASPDGKTMTIIVQPLNPVSVTVESKQLALANFSPLAFAVGHPGR